MLGWLAKEMPAGISTASPVDRLNTERGNPCSHAILQVEPGCFQPSEKLVSCAAMPLNPSQCCYLSRHLILTQQQIFWPVPFCVIDADVSHPDLTHTAFAASLVYTTRQHFIAGVFYLPNMLADRGCKGAADHALQVPQPTGHPFDIVVHGISDFGYHYLKTMKASFPLSHEDARYYFMRHVFCANF